MPQCPCYAPAQHVSTVGVRGCRGRLRSRGGAARDDRAPERPGAAPLFRRRRGGVHAGGGVRADAAGEHAGAARVPLRPGRLLRRAPLRAHRGAPLHFGEENHPEALLRPSAGYLALLGLGVHTLFDGVAIAAGFMIGPALGTLLSIAVVAHKVPEGFTIASIMLAGGQSRTAAAGAGALPGVLTA